MGDSVQLRKPLYEERASGPPGGQKRERAPLPPRQVPVFAGFWVRLLAILVDGLAIVLAHRGLAAVGSEEIFYDLGPLTPLVGLAALLAVLWAVPASLLNGQTPGMKILRLRIVGPDGEVPPAGTLLLRAIFVILPILPIYLFLMAEPLQRLLETSPVVASVPQAVMMALVLTQISTVAGSSSKRGLHDMWVKTFVIRLDATEPATPAEALEAFDDFHRGRDARSQRMATLMVPALVMVFIGLTFFQKQDEAAEEFVAGVRASLQEIAGEEAVVFSIEGAQIDLAAVTDTPVPEGATVPVVRGHFLGVLIPAGEDWEAIASSEAHEDTAAALMDEFQRQVTPEALAPLTDDELPPWGFSTVSFQQSYVLIPPLVGGRREHHFRRHAIPLAFPAASRHAMVGPLEITNIPIPPDLQAQADATLASLVASFEAEHGVIEHVVGEAPVTPDPVTPEPAPEPATAPPASPDATP